MESCCRKEIDGRWRLHWKTNNYWRENTFSSMWIWRRLIQSRKVYMKCHNVCKLLLIQASSRWYSGPHRLMYRVFYTGLRIDMKVNLTSCEITPGRNMCCYWNWRPHTCWRKIPSRNAVLKLRFGSILRKWLRHCKEICIACSHEEAKYFLWCEFKLCLILHEWVTSLSACVWRNYMEI